MHRQIAGKLTGPVTKWIVLAFWVLVVAGLAGLRRQAHRRPEQRGVVVAARPAPSRPRRWTSCRAVPGPQRHPDARRLQRAVRADPGRPRRAASRARPTELARSIERASTGAGASGPIPSEDGAGHADAASPSTSGKNGWNDMPDTADEIREIAPESTASTCTSPAPAARPPTPPRRSRASTPRCLIATARRRHRDPAAHLPQPDPVAAADHLAPWSP